MGLETEIVCVDTFLGWPGAWTLPEFRSGIQFCHGRPTLYEQFLANVIFTENQSYITPLPLSSSAAAAVLGHCNAQANLIYIDASHEYPDVKRDIQDYWPVLAPGGVMFGDDFSAIWPGVIRAVCEFSEQIGIPYYREAEKWILINPEDSGSNG